jgi:hypothetical protein
MSDDEIQGIAGSESAAAYGRPSHFDMDEAFCARMRRAIAAGLENAPIVVVTTPGTRNPIYLPTEQSSTHLAGQQSRGSDPRLLPPNVG